MMERAMKCCITLLFLTMFSFTSFAEETKELYDVKLPITETVGDAKLVLNGMGARLYSFLKFKVYVAGLYLEEKSSDYKKIITSDKIKKVKMRFLRNVSESKVKKQWDKNIDKKCKGECLKHKDTLLKLKAATGPMIDGGSMEYVFYPDSVEMFIDGKSKGKFPGKPVQQFILSLYIGEDPPNKELKKGLLGL